MSTMFPTEAEVRVKLIRNERAHETLSTNIQKCRMMIAVGITVRPTSKSDTARERRMRLVGVWSCLERKYYD